MKPFEASELLTALTKLEDKSFPNPLPVSHSEAPAQMPSETVQESKGSEPAEIASSIEERPQAEEESLEFGVCGPSRRKY